MTELDFDELDKAVNSLMKTAPNQKDPNLTNEQTVTITPTLPDGERPLLDTLNTSVASVAGSVPNAASSDSSSATATPNSLQSSVASRRGRFMDMVRPSSASQVSTPSRSSMRQGVTIEPKGSLVSDITPSTASPPASGTLSSQDTKLSLAPVTPEPAQKTDWPDPLDMNGYETTPVSLAGSDKESLSSPFLPDTKVEKRPLDASLVVSESERSDVASQVHEDRGTPNEQLPANPVDARPELPEELSTDLMALESDANTIAVPADEVKGNVAEQTAAVVSVETMPEPPASLKEEQAEVQTQPEIPVQPIASDHALPPGPISIPQQYREEPSTGDKVNGAIYDTDTYHQPLAHPKKKKSGWLWVMWTIVFLVLGAAGGAALYFLHVF